MCGRYQFSADEYKEIRQIVRDAQRRSEGNELNFTMAGDICPSQVAPCLLYTSMGNGSAAKLQKHLPLTQLDAIIISHLHFDHFGDLFCAKYALETKRAYGENLKPIPLFIPALPQWASEELCTNDVFQIHTIKDGAAYDFDEVHFTFFAVKHLIESYGVRISAEGLSLIHI